MVDCSGVVVVGDVPIANSYYVYLRSVGGGENANKTNSDTNFKGYVAPYVTSQNICSLTSYTAQDTTIKASAACNKNGEWVAVNYTRC
jgi:hypothetical protein